MGFLLLFVLVLISCFLKASRVPAVLKRNRNYWPIRLTVAEHISVTSMESSFSLCKSCGSFKKGSPGSFPFISVVFSNNNVLPRCCLLMQNACTHWEGPSLEISDSTSLLRWCISILKKGTVTVKMSTDTPQITSKGKKNPETNQLLQV